MSSFISQLTSFNTADDKTEQKSTRSIFIPTYANYIEIKIDDLPDPNDIKNLITVLRDNTASVKLWHRIALEYRKAGHMNAFKALVHAATLPDLKMNDWNEDETPHPGDTQTRVALLNCRGCMYINELQDAKKKEVDKIRENAAKCFMLADKIAVSKPTNIFSTAQYDSSSWVGKALLSFKLNKIDKAAANLKTALIQEKEHVPSLLAKACVQFSKRKYDNALKAFQQALEENSKAGPAQPEIYLGIGICGMKLKEPEIAKSAFERCLKVESTGPVSIRARAGLVMLSHGQSPDVTVEQAMKYLIEAHELSPSDPMTLILLGHVFFWKGEYGIARKSAGVALSNTNLQNTPLRAECAYLLGKSYHAESDYGNALKYYEEAVKLDRDNFMALFGLAQMKIYNTETEEALEFLQKVADRYPENVVILKIMGDLYYASGKETLAKKTLEKFVQLQPNDVNAFLRLAQVSQFTDVNAALNAYKKAVTLMKEQEVKIPFEVYNNTSALYYQLGEYPQALSCCEELINSFVDEAYRIDLFRQRTTRAKPLPTNAVTVYYNYGIYLEKNGRLKDAMFIYNEIISDYPDDIDCRLRVGMLCSALGNHAEALKVYDDATKQCKKSNLSDVNARSMKSICCLKNGDHRAANKEITSNYKKNPRDVYNIVALGNYNLGICRKSDTSGEKISEAAKWFYQALQLDPNNVYAANGIAVCLAELNLVTESKLILEQLREVTNLTDIWVNLGHIFVQKEVYPAALKKYETALRKVSDEDYNEIAIYLAKVYFDIDETTKNSATTSSIAQGLAKAKKLLTSVIHRDPTNEQAWYNLAVVQMTNATKILQKKHNKRTMEEVQEAMQDLTLAEKTFSRLSAEGTKERKKKCSKHAKWCRETIPNGEAHLKYHESQNAAAAKKRNEERIMLNEWKTQKAKIKEEQKKLALAAKAAALAQAKQAREKSDLMSREIADNARHRETQKRRKKQRRQQQVLQEEEDITGMEADLNMMNFDGEIGETVAVLDVDLGEPPMLPPKKKKKKKKRKLTERQAEEDFDIAPREPAEPAKKRKKMMEVNFDDRTQWTDLQQRLYARSKEIIVNGDQAQLSRKIIRKKLGEEFEEDLSSLKPWLKTVIMYIAQSDSS